MEGEVGLADVPVRRSKAALQECFTCPVCKEVFQEPYTIVECMHTFCRACIESQVEEECNVNECPVCGERLGYTPFKSGEVKFDVLLAEVSKKIFVNESDKEMAEKQWKMEEERRFAARQEVMGMLARQAIAPERANLEWHGKRPARFEHNGGDRHLVHNGKRVCVLLAPTFESRIRFLKHPFVVLGEHTTVKELKAYVSGVLGEEEKGIAMYHFDTKDAILETTTLRELNTRSLDCDMMYTPMLYGRDHNALAQE